MIAKEALYSKSRLTIKEVGVCSLFEYRRAAYNRTNKKQIKNYCRQQLVAPLGFLLTWPLGPASISSSGLTIGPSIFFKSWWSSDTLNGLLFKSLFAPKIRLNISSHCLYNNVSTNISISKDPFNYNQTNILVTQAMNYPTICSVCKSLTQALYIGI